jgi:hypothetical protein
MRHAISVVLVAVLASTAAASRRFATAQTAPPPCSAPEHRQFDFWIGTWDVYAPDGKLAGHNRIERIEGGCGLQENWTGAAGGTGRSLNAFSTTDRFWHQFWVGSGGGVLDLAGTFSESTMTLRGTSRPSSGGTVENRVSFTKNADGTVRQLWDVSRDGGKTWTVTFDGKYVRAPAKPR